MRKRRIHPAGSAFLGITLAGLLWPGVFCGAPPETINEAAIPPAAKVNVDFERDIKPIFEATCFRCHGPEKPRSHFSLATRETALKGGDDGVDIIPGASGKSHLIHYVAGLVEDMKMPPPGKGTPLTPAQIGLLRAWIDQGALWATNAPPGPDLTISPTVRWIGVSGDRNKFREIEGVKEGWDGGFDHFEFHDVLDHGGTVSVEGHAHFRDEDYKLRLALVKPDHGFIRGGMESWRKYYDDTGGYAPLLPTNFFSLNRDLHLDLGRVWLDLGLTLPNWPQIVAGYEYQFKQGDEATLQWGPVGTSPPYAPGTDAKNVYPASKRIDETTHIIKLDVTKEGATWRIDDSARVEVYDLQTSRRMVTQDTFGPTPDLLETVGERHHHTLGANTFTVSKQFTDWLSANAGYLYSRLEGDAAVQQNTVDGQGNPATGFQWSADSISLTRESQVVSGGGMLGPWQGLSLSAVAQGEWTRQRSMGEENLQTLVAFPGNPPMPFPQPGTITGDLDSNSARQNAVLRYTRIPYTTLFAETRLQQERLSRADHGLYSYAPIYRDSDEDIFSQEYRGGFSTSPWSRLSFTADFKHRLKHTEFVHLAVDNFGANYLYPGFLSWREILEDQAEARLVYRVAPWLKTSFTCRWSETDFDGATGGNPNAQGAIPVDAALQRARTYGFNALMTPARRIYLSCSFTYSDSAIATAQTGADYLAPWDGNIYSVISSATYALNPKTDLHATYSFSESDYGQNNQATGLPAGIDYTRHVVQAGLTRRFGQGLVTRLAYSYAQYREPTLGGANDYTAHGVFGTLTIPWK